MKKAFWELKAMRVFLSEDEEQKFIESEEDGLIASFAFGEWFDRKVVDLTALKELNIEEDIYEVAVILRQAKRALRYC